MQYYIEDPALVVNLPTCTDPDTPDVINYSLIPALPFYSILGTTLTIYTTDQNIDGSYMMTYECDDSFILDS